MTMMLQLHAAGDAPFPCYRWWCSNSMLLMMFQFHAVDDDALVPCYRWWYFNSVLKMSMMIRQLCTEDVDTPTSCCRWWCCSKLSMIYRCTRRCSKIWCLWCLLPPSDEVGSSHTNCCFYQYNTLLVKGECWNNVTSKKILLVLNIIIIPPLRDVTDVKGHVKVMR